MANRKKKSERRASRSAAPSQLEPFNNPFQPLRGLRRKLRDRALAAPARAPQRGAAKRDEPTRIAPPPRSDSEEFRAAALGAVPLDVASGRVRKRASARAATSAPSTVAGRAREQPTDFTADEHFDVRFSDRYIRGAADGVSRETLQKLERGELAVRSHVDLHGMALEDAKRAVDDFLFDRQRNGDRCVLVITGKGRNSRHQVGVLREKIPEWLARGPSARRVLAFVTARPCDGGEGALYVLLRKRTSPKARIDVVAGGGI